MGILLDHKQEIWMRTGTSSRSPRQGNCQSTVNKTVALLQILNACGMALQATLLSSMHIYQNYHYKEEK